MEFMKKLSQELKSNENVITIDDFKADFAKGVATGHKNGAYGVFCATTLYISRRALNNAQKELNEFCSDNSTIESRPKPKP